MYLFVSVFIAENQKFESLHRIMGTLEQVFMQLFNQINARKIQGEFNSFSGILDNWLFLVIMLVEVGGQVLIVQFGGPVFNTQGGLTAEQPLGVGEPCQFELPCHYPQKPSIE